MMDIETHVNAIKRGWRQVRSRREIERVTNGIDRLFAVIWFAFGQIASHQVMAALFIAVGAWHLFVLGGDGSIKSGLDIITRDESAQLWISMSMIAYGWLLASSRNIILLTLAALFVAYYTFNIASGTVRGIIDIRGVLAVIYLMVGTVALLIASYAAWRERQTRAELTDAINQLKAAQKTIIRYGENDANANHRDAA